MWMQRGRLPARQRGSIILPAAAALIVCLILLGSANLGYLFYAKREIQNAADLAALSGVQYIHADSTPEASCGDAKQQALLSLQDYLNGNKIVKLEAADITLQCGTWSQAYSAPEHFDPNPVEGRFNALKVIIDRGVAPILPFAEAQQVYAAAIAKSAVPVAAFQIGSELLRFEKNSVLGFVLEAVGLDIQTLKVLDSEGLATAKITPAGLLGLLGVDLGIDHLGVLTPGGLANIEDISLLRLLDVSLSLVTDSTLYAQLDALRKELLRVGIGAIKIPLLGSKDQPGLLALLQLGRQDELDAALDVQLGLGNLLGAAVALGVNGHAADIKLPSVLGLVKAKVTVVEPPTIAIGPVGTQGYSSQIRVALDVDTRNLLGGLLNVLVENILGIRVHLPIAVDVADAVGTLEALNCGVPRTMDLSVRANVANVCVGRMAEDNVMSHTARCDVYLGEEQLLKLLHIPVLSGKMHLPALEYEDHISGLAMEVGDLRTTEPNPLALGDTVDRLVTELLNLLGGLFREPDPSPWLDAHYDSEATRKHMVKQLVQSYLDVPELESQVRLTKGGAYRVSAITDLALNGATFVRDGETITLAPLVDSDFVFDKAVVTTCVLFACPSKRWKRGSFSEAFHSYTSVPSDLLGALGISTFDNGYRSCAGLLSSILNWNGCVEHNLTKLLQDHPAHVGMDDATMQNMVNQVKDPYANQVACQGVLCMLLKPVLNVLKPVLNGVGGLLQNVLRHGLGLELGRTEIKALDIQCEPAKLVY